MKIIFFGTPEFAKTFLATLHADEDISVSAVVCQPDKAVGRKKIITSPATKIFAIENNIPVIQAEKKSEILPLLKELFSHSEHSEESLANIDLFVIVAYGKIIPQEVLDLPKHGSINVHPSLLPKYRGPSPIQSAILNQDKETGVSIMLIDDKMDHGPILAQTIIPLNNIEIPETLRKTVEGIAAPLLVKILKGHVSGKIEAIEQDHDTATFCKLISKEDGLINWNNPAKTIEAQIRAYTPWPGTFTKLDGKTIKIHQVRFYTKEEGVEEPSLQVGEITVLNKKLFVGTNTSPLEILEIQPEGKAKMSAQAFLNGNIDVNGKKFE